MPDINFAQYKQGYGSQLWHTKLNQFIDAAEIVSNELAQDLDGLGQTVINWTRSEEYLVRIPSSPTYVNATTFTLVGDWALYTQPGSAIVADCVGNGAFFATIFSSTYATGTTTVVIDRSVLTASLARVFVANSRTGYLPSTYPAVLARDFGTPGSDALDAALAYIGSTKQVLVITGGDWNLTRGVTIPSNVQVTIVPGSKLVNSIATTKAIEAATKDNPCVITSTGHGLNTGDYIYIAGVQQQDWQWLNGHWQITKVDNNTFTIPFAARSDFAAYDPVTDPGYWQKAVVIDGALINQSPYVQVFSGPFLLKSMPAVEVNYFGRDATGLQNAIFSCWRGKITDVRFSTGADNPYVFTSGVLVPHYVNLVGSGNTQALRISTSCPILWTGSGPLFYCINTLENQRFVGFGVDISTNPNSSSLVMDANYGTMTSLFDFVIYRGTNTTVGTPLKFRGKTANGSANNALFFNEFRVKVYGGADTRSAGPAILIGEDEINCRANDNLFFYCYLAGYEEAIRIAGHNNTFVGVNCQQNLVGIHFISATGGTNSNTIINLYCDGFAANDPRIKVTNTHGSDVHVFTLVGDSLGVTGLTAHPILIDNQSTGLAFYTILSRSIVLGGPNDGTIYRNDQTPYIANQQNDGFLRIYGGASSGASAGGAILVCGPDVGATVNSVGPGVVLNVLNANEADAAFRISRTADGSSFSRLFEVTSGGAIRGLQTSNGPVGTFTLANDGSTTTFVSNTNVTSSSKVFITPTGGNAPDAKAKVTSVTNESGFTVTHNASPGAGCTFNYFVVN